MHEGVTCPFVLDHKSADGLLHDVDGNTFANHMSAWGAAPYGPFPAEVRTATTAAWDRYGMEISCFLQSEPVVRARGEARRPGAEGDHPGRTNGHRHRGRRRSHQACP